MLPIVLILFYTLQSCNTLDRRNFYDYSTATALGAQFIHIDTAIPYPHWSDLANTKIDVVNSGVVRLSGLDGANTLDILLFAVNIPKTNDNSIFYQELLPDATMKERLSADIGNPSFRAMDMLIFTWVDVPFTIGKLSTFQIVLVSDGNVTYSLLHLERLDHDNIMRFFPEVDLRYSFEEGTQFLRSGFLKEETGVATADSGTGAAAVEYSNSGKAGRWVLKLTDDPRGVNATASTQPFTSMTDTEEEVNNFTGITVRGKFVFVSLKLDNNELTSENDNSEINIVLSKTTEDERYSKLNTDVILWLTQVHEKAVGVANAKIDVISYKAGSLVVDYGVTYDNDTAVCGAKSGTNCLQDIEAKVKNEVKNGSITSGGLSGSFNPSKVEIAAYDVCTAKQGTFCDANAHCVAYRDKLSYGCACKDGYSGSGYADGCEKDGKTTAKVLIVTLCVMFCVLTVLIFAGVWSWLMRKEKHEMLRKELLVDELKYRKPERKNSFSEQLRRRSTRKVLMPARMDFDPTLDLKYYQ